MLSRLPGVEYVEEKNMDLLGTHPIKGLCRTRDSAEQTPETALDETRGLWVCVLPRTTAAQILA